MAMKKGKTFNPEQLVRLREKTGLSCKDFGAKVGVSRQNVYMWEHGETIPSIPSIERLCREFDVWPDYFFRKVIK